MMIFKCVLGAADERFVCKNVINKVLKARSFINVAGRFDK